MITTVRCVNHSVFMSRLQFESQRTRLNTQLEYEREQLHKQRRLIIKIQDSIKKEEDVILMLKKVSICKCLTYVTFRMVLNYT